MSKKYLDFCQIMNPGKKTKIFHIFNLKTSCNCVLDQWRSYDLLPYCITLFSINKLIIQHTRRKIK